MEGAERGRQAGQLVHRVAGDVQVLQLRAFSKAFQLGNVIRLQKQCPEETQGNCFTSRVPSHCRPLLHVRPTNTLSSPFMYVDEMYCPPAHPYRVTHAFLPT